MKPIFGRGPSLQLRLFLAVVTSVSLLIMDSRLITFNSVRSSLDTLISPLHYLANSPRQLLDSASERLESQDRLILENRALRQELLTKNSDLLMLEQLKHENDRLRELLGSPLRSDERKMVAQVLTADTDPYTHQVVIDKGSDQGVYIGQPVISDKGVVGQVISVGKVSSRVLLISDATHAIPVQVLRNDIRVIASGTGRRDELQLEHIPSSTDIRPGDMLVTSGLGGRFPEGYPVGIIKSFDVDSQNAFAVVSVTPTAQLERLRYLLLLWPNKSETTPPPTADEVREAARERIPDALPPLETAPDAEGAVPAGATPTSNTPSGTAPASAKPAGAASGNGAAKPSASTAPAAKPAANKPSATRTPPAAKPVQGARQ
ncbi:rod shape-determining protein MreC [Plesiomonas shigelloides]|uniref:Cell shape-determining protein MreC n=1 Tax=Plesiomonas shigelloides 302-73 TaxID=1315976 RepID=R8ATD5_PLESH|nr:rod shape-determining protein MreC [Plesiomonas shigelloides]EON89581.1 rod shape-determining protein MreC [Plesiomonas shigelloides 302-73]